MNLEPVAGPANVDFAQTNVGAGGRAVQALPRARKASSDLGGRLKDDRWAQCGVYVTSAKESGRVKPLHTPLVLNRKAKPGSQRELTPRKKASDRGRNVKYFLRSIIRLNNVLRS
jgi:hypothetical protein